MSGFARKMLGFAQKFFQDLCSRLLGDRSKFSNARNARPFFRSRSKIVPEIARIENFNARNARDQCFCRSVSTLPRLIQEFNCAFQYFDKWWTMFIEHKPKTKLKTLPQRILNSIHHYASEQMSKQVSEQIQRAYE